MLNKIHKLKLSTWTLFTLALVGLALFSVMAPSASAREYKDTLNADVVSPFRKVADKVVPAVVSIEVTRSMEASMKDHPFFEQFRNFMPDGEMPENHAPIPGSGSGFLIDADGLIVTNNHVVRDTESIQVTLPGERDSYEAEVLGLDPKTDLAVIRILDADGRRFPFVEQGDSESARVGDWAIAVGNPLGELEGSLTVGVISAKGRSQLAIQGGSPDFQDFIQTDAAINFGNSGGPLVDIHGRAIGINTAINAAGQGIGFAIPMQLAAKILPQLIEKGKVTRAYLGVAPMELDAEYAEALGLDIEQGILVREVVAGEPADQAGIREGDVITDFAGEEVTNIDAFRFLVAERAVGEKVDIRLHRDGDSLLKKVRLVEYPEDEPTSVGRNGQSEDFFGMQVEDLAGSDFAESMEIDADHGVVVTRIRAGSPAESAELRVGDVIQKIKNLKIRTLEDFEIAKEQFIDSDKRVGLLVQRKTYATFLFITPR